MGNLGTVGVGVREKAAERRIRALELRKSGASIRKIATALGVSRASIHKDLQRAMVELAAEQNASAEEVRSLQLARYEDLLLVLASQVRGGDLAAIDRARRVLDSISRLYGLLQPEQATQVNININPQWIEVRAVVLNALAAHPAAMDAVQRALAEKYQQEEGRHRGLQGTDGGRGAGDCGT